MMRKIVAASVIAIVMVIASAYWLADSLRAQPHKAGGGPPGVALQATTPGNMQTGNANISGKLCVGCSDTTHGATLGSAGTNVTLTNVASSVASPAITLTASNALSIPAFGRVLSIESGTTGVLAYFGFGSNTGIGRLVFGAAGGSEIVPIAGGVPLTLHGSGAAVADNVIVDTQGVTLASGNLLNVRNNGVSKASISFNGTPTFALPVPLTSGGTGQATALNCSAGQFWTSNGTSVSCAAAANGAIVASANVSSTGTINKQNPVSVISSVTKGGTGVYTINLTGMTATGIVTCTPYQGASPGYMCTATPASGTIGITIVNGANGVADQAFMLTVASL